MFDSGNNRYLLYRTVKDKLTTFIIRVGGLFVICAVILIFVYLLYKALPLFESPKVEQTAISNLEEKHQNGLYYGLDEYANIFYSLNSEGSVSYFDLLKNQALPKQTPFSSKIVAFNRASRFPDRYVLAFEDQTVALLEHNFKVSYPQNIRLVEPVVKKIWSKKISLPQQSQNIALREDDDSMFLASFDSKQLLLSQYTKESSLFDDETNFELDNTSKLDVDHNVDFLMLNYDFRWLIALSKSGELTTYQTHKKDIRGSKKSYKLENNIEITTVKWLLGDLSLLIGTSDGQVQQWFPVNTKDQGSILKKIRSFKVSNNPITSITSEYQRKVFAASDTTGKLALFYTSSNNELFNKKVINKSISNLVFSPQGNKILLLDSSNLWSFYKVINNHPESNSKQLWGKIHYESYLEPKYIWQSSAATQDFEPKFSLSPLLFGTIKGAFYAMIFAIPFAILGAIYTAFFMSSTLRRYVKPTIETMEALPTVILGFLAGLFIAPFVENNLMFLFVLAFVLPIGTIMFGFINNCFLSKDHFIFAIENRAISIIPILILLTLFSHWVAIPLQDIFFNGDLRSYVSHDLGIDYNQRNALVVGFAMGFAIIPTIFSITEDAVFSVPKHLVNGSLAMGATPWQTLTHVVIPTASPGIFSAVMIGFGRAVGETMIVLMATGNTPIMDFNIFEGMRTLSANIAVEMPESEVNGTHFRILFLAALVLFVFTFCFNTIAETVRHKLKKKYSEL